MVGKIGCVIAVAAALASGCSRDNPAVCCLTQAACDEVGIPAPRGCLAGFGCVAGDCVAAACGLDTDCDDPSAPFCIDDLCRPCRGVDADTEGCTAAAPVCDAEASTCVGCAAADDCAGYPETPLCDVGAGACVECLTAAECGGVTPVCDAGTCRGCVEDSECGTGFCDHELGRCAEEAEIVFVATNGTPGACSRAAPCGSNDDVEDALTVLRPYLQLLPGTYPLYRLTIVSGRVVVHGAGATLEGVTAQTGEGPRGALVVQDAELVVRGLTVQTTGNQQLGGAISASNSRLILDEVVIRDSAIDTASPGPAGVLLIGGAATLRRVEIDGFDRDRGSVEVRSQGSVELVGVFLRNGAWAVVSTSATVRMTNSIAAQFSRRAIESDASTLHIEFSTFYETRLADTGARLISCANSVGTPVVRNNVVWSPSSTAADAFATGPCLLSYSVVGPLVGGPGATNIVGDPLFVSPGSDFHLQAGSPAIDVVPARQLTDVVVDLDGDPRPSGSGFDAGADEVFP